MRQYTPNERATARQIIMIFEDSQNLFYLSFINKYPDYNITFDGLHWSDTKNITEYIRYKYLS
jgi:hypothetical protein